MPWKAAFNLGACVRKVLPRSRFATLTHTPTAEATNKRIREAPDAQLDLLQRSHTTNHRWPHARLIRSLTHKCDTDMRATLPTDRGPFQSQTAASQPLPALIHTQHGQPCENMIWIALVHGSRVCCTCTPMDTGLIPYPLSRPLLPPPRLAACKLPVDCTHTRRREEVRQVGRC